ncbi:MAG: hypothetical protein ACIAQF_02825 [Phycisphaerales bacterium JB065]
MTNPHETKPHEYSEGHDRAEHEALDHARSVLSAYREGVLFMDDQHTPIHFVTEHATGRLIASVPAATFFASQHALFVPEETDDALQLLLTCEEIEESDSTDRWIAFHMGESEHPEHTRWAAFWIDSAKHGPWVFDGEAMMVPNPVADLEPKTCKTINARRDELARVTAELTGADATDGALCVGVDPGGLYVRLRHGVVRVPFPEPDEESTIETLDSLVERLLAS